MVKIVSSFVRDNRTGRSIIIHSVLKKSKSGKQLLKNFKTKKEAEKYAKK